MAFLGTVSIGFDRDSTYYPAAVAIMAANNIIPTAYLDPANMSAPVIANMLALQAAGWDIQAYSGTMSGNNMVDSVTLYGLPAVTAHLANIKSGLIAAGFNPTVLAPSQRRWSSELRTAVVGMFDAVRAVYYPTLQSYPVPDPLYVDYSGTASLSDNNQTAAQLRAIIDNTIATGSWFLPVAHEIGNDGSPYSLSLATFTDFCEYMKSKVDAGLLRVVPFSEGLAPTYIFNIDPVSDIYSQIPSVILTGARSEGAAITGITGATLLVSVSYPTTTTWSALVFGLIEGNNTITVSADYSGVSLSDTITLSYSSIATEFTEFIPRVLTANGYKSGRVYQMTADGFVRRGVLLGGI